MPHLESETHGGPSPRILIVDDKVENLIGLERILADLDVDFVRALSGDEALAWILEHDFALILLDVQMPVMDGFETAELIRSDENSKHIPIVFVTALSHDQTYEFQGYASGAVDYLTKPLNPDILKSKVGVFVDLYRQKMLIAQANAELKAANHRILEQQETMIEEERLKVLLQMAGASAHELNQPLMSLLGNIELIRMIEDDPAQVGQRLNNIETAGQRIADIVQKMQSIQRSDVIDYPGGQTILNLDQKTNLLVVEDSDIDFEALVALVKDQEQIGVTRAVSISEGLGLVQQTKVDMVLLDYLLPDGNGFDFLDGLKAQGMEIPVIAITGHGDEVVASRMIKAGAYDYLPKAGADRAVLLRSIKTALEQSRLKKDVAQATQKLAQMATCDGLTGLSNRRRMNDMLSYEFNRAVRFGTDLSCLMLDLDDFKQVNDSLGHGFGDFVLKQFATRLTDSVRESDACFRYGGEEFMVLMPQTDMEEAKKRAEKIRRLCHTEPYRDDDHERVVTVSIGVASLHHRAAARPEDLLACADKALYRSKAEGRNRVSVYFDTFAASRGADGGQALDTKILKDRFAALMEKTKKASVASFELLMRDAGSSRFKDHNRRVVHYLGLVGERLGLPPAHINTMQFAAALHDCTKVLLPQKLMGQKRRLNAAEMAEIKAHTCMLAELVEPFDFFADERTVLLHHHEKYDGSGYPNGLKGDKIPIGARIFAIVDALVAMTSDRPHRPGLSAEQVVQELVDNAGMQFDPHLVGLFLDVIEENNLIDIPAQKMAEAKALVHGIQR
jgi:two-component system cell cycle response regulator